MPPGEYVARSRVRIPPQEGIDFGGDGVEEVVGLLDCAHRDQVLAGGEQCST